MTASHSLLEDFGGLRSGEDRRLLQISFDCPERRSGEDRRKVPDRRSGQDRRSPDGFRAILKNDRRSAWANPGSKDPAFFSL